MKSKKDPEIVKITKLTQQFSSLDKLQKYEANTSDKSINELLKDKSQQDQLVILSAKLANLTQNTSFEKLASDNSKLTEEHINNLKEILFKLEQGQKTLGEKFSKSIQNFKVESLDSISELKEIADLPYKVKEITSNKDNKITVFDDGISRFSTHNLINSLAGDEAVSIEKAKKMQQLRDYGLIKNTFPKSGTREIIETPGAWVMCSSDKERTTYRELFSTKDLEGLTIKSNNKIYKLEDYLHNALIIENKEKEQEKIFEYVANADVKSIMLMSDQTKSLNFLSDEEKNNLSKEDLKEWLELTNSNAITLTEQLSKPNSESKLTKLKLLNERDNEKLANLVDADGNTPLHIAAKKGDSDLVKKLLEVGFNPNITNGKNKTFIDVSKKGSKETINNIYKEFTEQDTHEEVKQNKSSIANREELENSTSFKLTEDEENNLAASRRNVPIEPIAGKKRGFEQTKEISNKKTKLNPKNEENIVNTTQNEVVTQVSTKLKYESFPNIFEDKKKKFLDKLAEEYGSESQIYKKAEKYINDLQDPNKIDFTKKIDEDHGGYEHKFAELFSRIRRTDKQMLKEIQGEFSKYADASVQKGDKHTISVPHRVMKNDVEISH